MIITSVIENGVPVFKLSISELANNLETNTLFINKIINKVIELNKAEIEALKRENEFLKAEINSLRNIEIHLVQ